MSQTETKSKKVSTFTCPNNSCGRVFLKPIKALNLQANAAGPYDACPYCLTEIIVENELPVESDEPKMVEVEEELEPVESTIDASEKAHGCGYHLGYLSERSLKDQIPDSCMTCKDIVECMLKKMKA
ncbi:hypothetical protein G4O51_09020 [Candidatus Bathyarchaeota archaeon A05DMB-2]|jgi:hypothetical protein|nr:hypothetical protein [Candidatus Bathyarchaeota archaeon A05DMB-2]